MPIQDIFTADTNAFIHVAAAVAATVAWVIALIVRTRAAKMNDGSAPLWSLFATGLFFFAAAQYADMFTPLLKSHAGLHNYLSTLLLLVGLAALCIALRRLLQYSFRPG